MPRGRALLSSLLGTRTALLVAALALSCDRGAGRDGGGGAALPPPRETLVLDLVAGAVRAEVLADTPVLRFGSTPARAHYEDADLRHLAESAGWISREGVGQDESGAVLVGGRATFRLTVLRPRPDVLELTGVAVPSSGGAEAVLAVRVNGRAAGEVALPRGLQPATVRVPLADGVLQAGANEVELSLPGGVEAELPELPFPVVVSGWFTEARLAALQGPDERPVLAVHGEGDGARVLQAAGSGVRHHHWVSAGERLRGRVTARGGELAVRVDVTPSGGTAATLLHRTLAPGEHADLDEDLAPFAGSPCRLELQAGEPGDDDPRRWLEGSGLRVVRDEPPPAAGGDATEAAGERLRSLAPAPLVHARRPDIVIVLLDAAAAAFFRDAGGEAGYAPAIEALAEEAVAFTRAVTPAPYTLPSVGSLFTGMLPDRHGVVQTARLGGGNVRLSAEAPTLAEALRGQGYATYAVVTNPNAAALYGYDRGFERYDELFADPALWDEGVDPQATVQHALSLLAAHEAARPEQPFLLYLHLFPPHAPYDPAARASAGGGDLPGSRAELDALKATPPARRDPAALARLRALYAANLGRADAAVATLLAWLSERDVLDGTLLALCADHGEAFGEHGDVEHGRHLYDETVRVPLLLRLPRGEHGGRRIDVPVSLLDLAPTLAAAGGARDALVAPDGRDLRPLLDGAEADPDRVHLARSDVFRPSWSLRWRGWVYVHDALSRRSELYEVDADPRQQHELAAERPIVAATLRARLCRELCALLGQRAGESLEVGESFVQSVESLGYVGSGGGAPERACPLLRR